MAYKTLVTNPPPLVRQVLAFLRSMTERKKDFTLAMLVPSETGLSDKWNLVLSALWIDRDGLKATIPTITSSLLEHLSSPNAHKLERVSVLPTTDPLVDMLADYQVSLGEVYLLREFWARREFSAQAGVPQLEGAFVLVAEQPRTSRGQQPQPAHSRA